MPSEARSLAPGWGTPALAAAALLFVLAGASAARAAEPGPETRVSAVRVWPAPDYTRITLESPAPLRYNVFGLKDPERLVLDLEVLEIGAALASLADKIAAGDPYVKGVRIGRFKPGVVRVVFDLKTEVRPQVFALAPIAEYGHRLVLDLYPLATDDPLLALLNRLEAERAAVAAGGALAEPPREPTPPAARAPRASPPPAPLRRLIVVAVDAGHGGEDPGARGRGGTYEKDVTLAIARKLKERIDREPGMRGVLIRDGDYFIPLHTRVAKARRLRADLLVSIHADAFVRPEARGSSVFALSESGATSEAARWLAKQENEADLIGGVNLDVADPYLKRTLLDLSQTATIHDSLKVGRAVLAELGTVNVLHKPQVEQAGFAVLKAPDIPSILVETAFISNPQEERKLRDRAYQAKIADAIFRGIQRYFAQNPPLARDQVVMTP